jgi:hypothetical protein
MVGRPSVTQAPTRSVGCAIVGYTNDMGCADVVEEIVEVPSKPELLVLLVGLMLRSQCGKTASLLLMTTAAAAPEDSSLWGVADVVVVVVNALVEDAFVVSPSSMASVGKTPLP